MTATQELSVGDWVTFNYGPRRVWAQIIEDRGRLGVNQRKLFRIRIDEGPSKSTPFEMPSDDLGPEVLRKAEILDYLPGNLIEILKNADGGRSPTRAWFKLGQDGKISHTFDGSHGLIGGAVIPIHAVEQGRVFSARREQVIEFLASFGLTRAEASEIVAAVGTTP